MTSRSCTWQQPAAGANSSLSRAPRSDLRRGGYGTGGVASSLFASITITGDAWSRATDKTYRLDTPTPRDFLDEAAALP